VRRLIALTNEQQVPLKFEEWSNTLAQHFGISKIAEASYSEVYRLSLLDQHPTLTTADESVLKLIAIKPPFHDVCTKKTKAQQRREEDMSSVSDIMSEVRLLKRMTEIPGFTNYRALHILQGRPSQPFIQAWKEWNKARRKGEKSEFPDPGRKASYDEDQYWAVIEMQDAGTDVERLLEVQVKEKDDRVEDGTAIRSIWATWDIFWQTVLAVAKGESEARFEHRDLHLGNICVRRKDGSEEHTATEDGLERKLGFSNFETTIIDYTLSRADMSTLVPSRPQSSYSGTSGSSLASASSITSTDIEIAYNPLQNQPKIFEGDAEVDYQYEIYRYMRTIVGSGSLSEGDIWHPYQPKTNILWLHFILHKLCETLQWPSETAKRSQTKRQMKALELEEVLAQVENLLNIERLMGEEECLLTSAAELVAVALEQGWLDQEDINS
jgi:serine/threonine-protein kinase haspin